LVVGAFTLAVVAAAGVIGAGSYYEFTRTSAGDVRGMIEENVPADATTDQVLFFLDSRDIERSPIRPADPSHERLQDVDLPDGATTVSAIIRNDGYSVELVDVEMIFVLDAEGRLAEYIVYETRR
jgi:hypothetical protein